MKKTVGAVMLLLWAGAAHAAEGVFIINSVADNPLYAGICRAVKHLLGF